MQNEASKDDFLKKSIRVFVLIGSIFFYTVLFSNILYLIVFVPDSWVLTIVKEHFVYSIGIPFAVFGAFFIVMVLEYTNGPIEIEGLGLKFKGASGPLLMWILCFLSIVFSYTLVW